MSVNEHDRYEYFPYVLILIILEVTLWDFLNTVTVEEVKAS